VVLLTDSEAFGLIFACNMNHTREQLKKLQSLTLEQKIQATKVRIGEWYQHYDGKVYVSFSGGKDSTVLLHIARECFPDIEAVFVDTGLEYPEIRQFVKQHDNVTILRPEMRFDEVIKKYGYPVISKEVSQAIYEARAKPDGTQALKFETGNEHSKKYGPRYDLSKWKFLLESDVPISHMCCKVMKKRPCWEFEKRSGKHPLLGMMAEESALRESLWMKRGCNAFNLKSPQSQPMAFWTEQDVLTYLKATGLPYCSVYGDIVADNEGQTELYPTEKHYHCTGCQRTGCMFCMFGVHLESEPNRFQRMKITHPKQYDYCINQLGIGKVLDFIHVKY
jgi:3'-phosphoadenosine 5'-phosphosulfate sulfotransferase (PAPS reductase)/FAD synthetase